MINLNLDKLAGDKITQKGGKIKNCTPGKTFACGGSCFSIGRTCNKNIESEMKEQAKKIVETTKSTKKESKKETKSLNKKKFPKKVQIEQKTILENEIGKNDPDKNLKEASPKEIVKSTLQERVDFNNNLIKEVNRDDAPYGSDEYSILSGLATKGDMRYIGQEMLDLVKDPPYLEELVTIKNYTGSAFSLYNKHLRGTLNQSVKNIIKKNGYENNLELSIKMATAGLESMPNFVGEVKRSASLPKEVFDYYKDNIGKEITEKGFTSTTTRSDFTDLQLVKEYGGKRKKTDKPTLFRIQSKNGKQVKSLSLFPYEEEIVFKPNTKFKIKSIEDGSKYSTVVLEEID